MIEVERLSVSRGGARVLRDVSLRLPEGGLTAIIGPNGAGKSTLLHALAGLVAPEGGQVRIAGQDIHRIREDRRARLVSLLTQSQAAVPRLSVGDLVAFGRWPHHRGRPTREDARLTEAALERFDLVPLATREVETLSGGQRQRAFLAMAYAQATPWMLLDEPLAALDPKYTRDIMDRLRDIAADPRARRSVVLVLHDLTVAARHADRCVALKAGALHCAGPWEAVVTSEVLSGLYDTPLRLAKAEGAAVVVNG
jgi:iron complex transport system ATP-binding protein